MVMALTAATGGFGRAQATGVPSKAPPNVLLIVVDDLNTLLGCYGNDTIKSPNIDRLAARGVRFERGYCQYPLCNPSRVSFLSGRRPETTGVYDLSTSARKALPGAVLLPQYFRQSGYYSAGAGKVFHSATLSDPDSWDFYEDLPPEDPEEQAAIEARYGGPDGKAADGRPRAYPLSSDGARTRDGKNVRTILRLIEQKAAARQPFFLAAGFHKPHLPWTAPRKFFALYPAGSIVLPIEPALRDVPPIALQTELSGAAQPDSRIEAIRGYYACVSFTDSHVGLLLDQLDRLDLWDRTVVVLLGDNGFHLGDHGSLWAKLSAFDASTRVPLLIAGAGVPAGKVITTPVELLDLYPTLVDLAGLAQPKGLEGQSLVPLMRRPQVVTRRPASSVVLHYDVVKRVDVIGRTVISEQWRYTEWDGRKAGREFYWRADDPAEYQNLAGAPRFAAEVEVGEKILGSTPAPKPGPAFRPQALLHMLPAIGLGSRSVAAELPVRDFAPIEINLTLPLRTTEVELRFRSARNRSMSKMTDISPNHPAPQTVLPSPKPDKEVWYPVIDLQLNAGMSGVLQWQTAPRLVAVNHHFHGKTEPGRRTMTVDAAMLESWENNVYCEPAVALEDFYLTVKVAVVDGCVRYAVPPLCQEWAGSVTVVDGDSGHEVEVARFAPKNSMVAAEGGHPVANLKRENVEQSLLDSVNYILRAQNRNPSSPTGGGLHLFYDLDAQTYRSSYWIWGAGPAVSALIEAGKISAIAQHFPAQHLIATADQIGRSSLGLRIMDPGHPAYGIPISRWRRAIELPFGFEQCAAPSDANFLSGWAWLPLYRETGNRAYLDAAELLAASTARLMKDYELVPQDYYVDRREWSEHTIDESGFGVEGLSALYAVTGDRRYQQQADDYMKQHVAKLARADGLWERGWNRRTGVMPTIRMTRGLGWAMEGLLAANQAVPDGGYLARARRMADQMAKWQRADGSWVFIADQPVEGNGISEKGTALWSLLYYRLYHATGEASYLATARKALTWCVAHQYRGPDLEARGGIVGVTEHSAVGAGHRAWFRVACAYTSGFAALAAIEELKLQPRGADNR